MRWRHRRRFRDFVEILESLPRYIRTLLEDLDYFVLFRGLRFLGLRGLLFQLAGDDPSLGFICNCGILIREIVVEIRFLWCRSYFRLDKTCQRRVIVLFWGDALECLQFGLC